MSNSNLIAAVQLRCRKRSFKHRQMGAFKADRVAALADWREMRETSQSQED